MGKFAILYSKYLPDFGPEHVENPSQNISEQEFLKFKSDWLIKNSNEELIEEYLIKNQIVNLHPELARYFWQ